MEKMIDTRIPINVGDIVSHDGDVYEVCPEIKGCKECDYWCGAKGAKQFACCPDEDLEQSFPSMILRKIEVEDDGSEEMSLDEFYRWKLR